MKAIIMAGGEGSRLRPLTCDCPKPMVPVMDRPVMEYALDLLKSHGVTQIGATLMYLPERISGYFGDGSEYGVSLSYYVEEKPLGTAGSVRQAIDFLSETCVVLSGDGLTDCNLTQAYEFHKARGAMATLVLKRVDAPLEYGVVITDAEGRVKRFVEKPGWGEVFSDTVNTGIYLLEPEALKLIPEDKPYDFGRELFPRMVKMGLPVYGWQMDGYWCDIGDTSAYLKAHADIMDGRIKGPYPLRAGGVIRMPGAMVDRGAVLEGPCFIGQNARVEEGARIGPYSVLGAGSIVEKEASVKRSVLWHGARVRTRGQARGCVLQSGAQIGLSASAFEESVLGGGASLGTRSVLMPGVRVWPHKMLGDGERIDQNVVWGAQYAQRFIDGRLPLATPIDAVRDAQAYSEAIRPGEVLIARDASPIALANAKAAAAGLMAQGVQVIDLNAATLPQLRCALWSMDAKDALYITDESMLPLSSDGAILSRGEQRKLSGALIRQDYPAPFSGYTPSPMQAGRTDLIYIGALLNRVESSILRAKGPRLAIYAPREIVLSLAERVCRRAGCAVRAEWEEEMMELSHDEIGLWLSESGESVAFADANGVLTEAEGQLLLAWALLEDGHTRLIQPTGGTEGVDALAERYNARVVRVKSEHADWMRALIDEDKRQFMMYFDGVYAALKALERLTMAGLTLRAWLEGMPKVYRRTRVVPVDLKEKGQIMRVLAERAPDADLSDGVRVKKDRGWAWISPAGDRGECLVVSEAADAEFAKEMCDFYATEVEKIHRLGKDSAQRDSSTP